MAVLEWLAKAKAEPLREKRVTAQAPRDSDQRGQALQQCALSKNDRTLEEILHSEWESVGATDGRTGVPETGNDSVTA